MSEKKCSGCGRVMIEKPMKGYDECPNCGKKSQHIMRNGLFYGW